MKVLRFQTPRKSSSKSEQPLPPSPLNSPLSRRVRNNMDRFQVLALVDPKAAEYLLRWTEQYLDATVGPMTKARKQQ